MSGENYYISTLAGFQRVAEDPWMRTGILRNMEIYPWKILLGKLP